MEKSGVLTLILLTWKNGFGCMLFQLRRQQKNERIMIFLGFFYAFFHHCFHTEVKSKVFTFQNQSV